MSFTPMLAPHAPDWITNEWTGVSFCGLCGVDRGKYAAAHPVKVETLPPASGAAFFRAAR